MIFLSEDLVQMLIKLNEAPAEHLIQSTFLQIGELEAERNAFV